MFLKKKRLGGITHLPKVTQINSKLFDYERYIMINKLNICEISKKCDLEGKKKIL